MASAPRIGLRCKGDRRPAFQDQEIAGPFMSRHGFPIVKALGNDLGIKRVEGDAHDLPRVTDVAACDGSKSCAIPCRKRRHHLFILPDRVGPVRRSRGRSAAKATQTCPQVVVGRARWGCAASLAITHSPDQHLFNWWITIRKSGETVALETAAK
jgi:hypothetical protein